LEEERPLSTASPRAHRYDVVILGGGLAGQSLARQLLLYSDKRILLVDKRAELPAPDQKVGEATVQVSGYYFSKILDLEEHLLREHYLKYNLRFYWKSPGRENRNFEDYSQAFYLKISNVPTYQLDRNKIEAEMWRLNRQSERFEAAVPARVLDLELAADDGPHRLRLDRGGEPIEIEATWVVDCTGRGRLLANKLGLLRQGPIRHGSMFLWVEGLVNFEKLTELSHLEMLRKRDRAAIGHFPLWLATNHFCDEGLWFWVIPLQGKTSLGLVFDRAVVDHRDVSTPEKLIAWVCKKFPLFKRDLPHRKVIYFSGIPDYGYDCRQTVSAQRWALTGMAGRFTDPLYSPGGDLIAIYNTAVADAIMTSDPEELKAKVRAYEPLMRAVYESYVPSFAQSYDALGDPEAYTLKYTWELAVYFAFFVFPFLNGLFTDRRFLLAFLNRFTRLGPINRNLHRFISAYFQWGKEHLPPLAGPIFHDFPDLAPLAWAEKTFYQMGLTVDEAKPVLAEQLGNLQELARFCLAYLSSVVVDDPAALHHQAFVAGIDLDDYPFDPEAIRRRWAAARRRRSGTYAWPFDATAMEKFRAARKRGAELATEEAAATAEAPGRRPARRAAGGR
jgi:flavin-dependent dehydrogenase